MAAKRTDYGTTPRDTTDRPEFPKPLVRLKPDAGGYTCDVRIVADSDDESAAKDAGWEALTGTLQPPDFQEYPKWVYHADGRRQVVYTEEDANKLEGFTATPPTGDDPLTKDVPAPVAQAGALDPRQRPPVPVDRG